MNLVGRISKCYCGDTQPSNPSLPFFDYRGDGRVGGVELCGICNFAREIHQNQPDFRPSLGCPTPVPHDYVVHAPYPTDTHYCGCRGWD